MTKKRLVFWAKLIVLVAVAVLVGRELYKSWGKVEEQHLTVAWGWTPLAVAGFCAAMLTSAVVWRWLAGRMGEGERLPTVPLLGAYTFSQMGKYIPGKVALLFMRIDRAGRLGMPRRVVTISTILENVLYLISGGIVGMFAVLRILAELRVQGRITVGQERMQWPLILAAIVAMCVVCTPKIFYSVVNRILRGAKREEVLPKQRLKMGTLALAVVGFVPVWIFGGVALWASANCVAPVGAVGSLWLAGAFALSVILGMVSLLPGGLGVRELVVGAAVTLQFTPAMGHDRAVLLAVVVAAIQRLCQVVAEVILGVAGGMLTSLPAKSVGTETQA